MTTYSKLPLSTILPSIGEFSLADVPQVYRWDLNPGARVEPWLVPVGDTVDAVTPPTSGSGRKGAIGKQGSSGDNDCLYIVMMLG